MGTGYGMMWNEQKKLEGAHRIAWRMTFGPIPKGIFILHTCDNRPCVRPDHLFSGTQSDNARDMHQKGRWHYKYRDQSGEKNPAAKLSDAEVQEMRELFDRGEATQAELMRRFGATRANVHMIVRRKSRI